MVGLIGIQEKEEVEDSPDRLLGEVRTGEMEGVREEE